MTSPSSPHHRTRSTLGGVVSDTVENDVEERRQALGLSRKRLAELAGVSESAIYVYEHGRQPRGGRATIERIEESLETQKGGTVTATTVISVGDVVSGTVAGEQIMLVVRSVSETAVVGTQLESYDHGAFKECLNAGANCMRVRGCDYILNHSRTLRRESLTGHWVML